MITPIVCDYTDLYVITLIVILVKAVNLALGFL